MNPRARQVTLMVLAMTLAAVALWGGFSAWVLTGDNYQRIYPELHLMPDPVEWRLIEGTGALNESGFLIHEPGLRARFLLAVSLPFPIDAQTYSHLAVKVSENRDYLPLSLSWSRARTFMPVPGVPMDPGDDGWFEMQLTGLPGWQEQIHFLAIENFGALNEPLLIESILLHERRPDFLALQARLLGDWLSPHPWHQRSAHNTRSSLYEVLVSPLIAAVSWISLSTLLFLLMSWRRALESLPWLALPILIGWLALDLRWQMDLFLKASNTWRDLGSLSLEQKRLAGPDADLVEFLNELPDLGASPFTGRVFVFGRSEYWRTRARYHLVPLSVRIRSDESWNRPLATAVEAGDVIILLDAPLLQVAPSDQEGAVTIHSVQVDDSTVAAQRLISRNGYQSFVVDSTPED